MMPASQRCKRGRPRKRCRWLLADKGYDADALRRYCDRYRMQPVIPLRAMKRKPKPGLPRLFDRSKYRQRNVIERIRLAERKPPNRDSSRQARKKLWCDGFCGLCHAVSATPVFRQSLSCQYGAKTAPKGTKKALAINAKCLICLACLVEPGGFEPPSASVPLSVLHA